MHHAAIERALCKLGLDNYWGYNTIGFFAPDAALRHRRALGAQVTEFKTMVKAFHRVGLEVILDVVYNHTAKGNQFGPDALFPGHRQHGLLSRRHRETRAVTSTPPVAATRCTCTTRARSSSSWTACATG